MKKSLFSFIFIIISISILNGCSKNNTYEGNQEYSELKYRNIVYRDLTKPLSDENFNETQYITQTPSLL